MPENISNPFEETGADTIPVPSPEFDINAEELEHMSKPLLLHQVNMLEDEIQRATAALAEKEAEVAGKYNPSSSFFLRMGGPDVVAKLKKEDLQPFSESVKRLKDEQAMYLARLKQLEKNASPFDTDGDGDDGDGNSAERAA